MNSQMDIEDTVRLLALKKAAIVMNALAGSLKDAGARQETKTLAWTITWAVDELERLKRKPEESA